ncbi:holin [Bacillus phage Pascal]|uniref:Holin n=1 Tax=Bacillus phage Pascal TaxID=1540092 RepID=A0A0A0RSY1_9CAUD|nr:holin [Bacillus phage Pascal]AIW03656.1 holin [Bacillus phage Pascal]
MFEMDVIRIYLFGQVRFLDLLVLLMFCDIVTGILKAWKNKRLRSRSALYGYARKIGMLVAIIVANVVDQVLNLGGLLAGFSVLWYIVNEALSILENLNQMGVNVLPGLSNKLHVVQAEMQEQGVENKELNPILEKTKEEK